MSTITDRLKIASFLSSEKLFLFIILLAIGTGIGIVTGQWLLAGILLFPVIIYVCIEKPFIFPFGLYVFLLPFDSILSVTEGGATVTKFLGILTILVLLFKGVFEKKLKRPDNTALWWILFMIYGALSILWAIQPEDAIARLPTAVGLLTFYVVAASYKSQKSEFDTLKWCILTGGLLAAAYVIYNYSNIVDARMTMQVGERSTDPNQFAFSLIIPIAVCIQLMMEHKQKIVKALLGVVLGLISFAIIVTGSRGGFLGVGVVIATYVLCMKHKVTFSTILIVIGIIIFSFVPDFFVERWGEAIEGGGAGRFTIWYVGLKALGEYWAFGAGLNNFPNSYGEFAFHDISKGWYRGAHNIYLELLVELGITGFTLMFLAMVKHYRALRSRFILYVSDSIMLKASFWAILVSSFFLGTFWRKPFWLLWMLIIMHRNIVEKKITEQVDAIKK